MSNVSKRSDTGASAHSPPADPWLEWVVGQGTCKAEFEMESRYGMFPARLNEFSAYEVSLVTPFV